MSSRTLLATCPCIRAENPYNHSHEFCFGDFGLPPDGGGNRRGNPAAGGRQAAVPHHFLDRVCRGVWPARLHDALAFELLLRSVEFGFHHINNLLLGPLIRSPIPCIYS